MRDRSVLLSHSMEEIDRLKREIKACEALIKHHENNEKTLKECMKKQDLDIEDLKKKSNPLSNTLDYIEERFDKKLETLKECLILSIKTTSYADVMKSNSQPIFETTTHNGGSELKQVLK